MILVDELARHWWVVGLRGALAVLFGILAIVLPGITLATLVLLFGAYALADGVLAIVAAIRGDAGHRVGMAIEGALGVVAGLVAFAWPAITALVLLYIIAFWAITTGLLEVWVAWRLRRVITNELGLIVGGVLSVVFGLFLVVAPGAGALTVVWLIGAFAVIFGITLLLLAWRLRQHHVRTAPSLSGVGRAATP